MIFSSMLVKGLLRVAGSACGAELLGSCFVVDVLSYSVKAFIGLGFGGVPSALLPTPMVLLFCWDWSSVLRCHRSTPRVGLMECCGRCW